MSEHYRHARDASLSDEKLSTLAKRLRNARPDLTPMEALDLATAIAPTVDGWEFLAFCKGQEEGWEKAIANHRRHCVASDATFENPYVSKRRQKPSIEDVPLPPLDIVLPPMLAHLGPCKYCGVPMENCFNPESPLVCCTNCEHGRRTSDVNPT